MGADSGKAAFVQFMMDNGGDVEIPDGSGVSPYDVAKNAGHKDVCAVIKPGTSWSFFFSLLLKHECTNFSFHSLLRDLATYLSTCF